MIRPQSVMSLILSDSGCKCSKCVANRKTVAYIVALEDAIFDAEQELNNLYPNCETVRQLLRGEK